VEEDPEMFFPIGNTGHAIVQIEEAKEVCRQCEVRETCLRWALDTGQDAGVWGGLSEDERQSLKRRTARARTTAERAGVAPPKGLPPTALVPAVETLQVVVACRDAGKTWSHIADLLGTSESTCQDIYKGTRRSVARALEDKALSVADRVDA
jgi:WhiB family redox-sensing transcriptional regulator